MNFILLLLYKMYRLSLNSTSLPPNFLSFKIIPHVHLYRMNVTFYLLYTTHITSGGWLLVIQYLFRFIRIHECILISKQLFRFSKCKKPSSRFITEITHFTGIKRNVFLVSRNLLESFAC